MPDDTILHALDRLKAGDVDAWSMLVTASYAQLRAQAQAVLAGRVDTLQATALLHEALVDLQPALSDLKFEQPAQWFALVSLRMRRCLIDYRRQRDAQKRGGRRERVHLDDDAFAEAGPRDIDVLMDLNDALAKLRTFDERLWRVAELRYSCGLTMQQIAEAVNESARAVSDDLTFVKAWLRRQMQSGEPGADGDDKPLHNARPE